MKDLYQKLVEHKEKISIIELGYVGMPIAVAFAGELKVIGFDINHTKQVWMKRLLILLQKCMSWLWTLGYIERLISRSQRLQRSLKTASRILHRLHE